VQLPRGDPTTWTAPLDVAELAGRITICRTTTGAAKGKPLEHLVTWLLPHIPGFRATRVNLFSAGQASEIDVVLWNFQDPAGFPSFPDTLMVECKNWDDPVDSSHVAWFDWKLRLGGAKLGILVAASGITGNAERKSQAWSIIQAANMDGRRILVVSLDDIAALGSRSDLRDLVIEKTSLLAGRAAQIP
jgi:hypothetical protein